MWSPSDTLLIEYLAGRCAAADARAIERWLAEDPANRARCDELRVLWQSSWPPVAPDVDAMWSGMQAVIRADRERRGGPAPARMGRGPAARPGRTFSARRPRQWWRKPLAAAAAITAILVGASLAIQHEGTDGAVPFTGPGREYVTPRGQRATVQLSDGTRLILAAASRLRIPLDYGQRVREVVLEGEAFFEVVHDSTRPFRVRIRDAVAEDLGTKFDVRAYPEDTVVAVAVAQGAVALGRAEEATGRRGQGDVPQGVILREGELGTLAANGRVTTATGSVVETYLAWTMGRLRFVDTPLPAVLRAIGRWYDLDIRVEAPSLAARTVTAEVTTQSADEMVRALALALDARVQHVGKVVVLQPKS